MNKRRRMPHSKEEEENHQIQQAHGRSRVKKELSAWKHQEL
jgi:hypothetical protein